MFISFFNTTPPSHILGCFALHLSIFEVDEPEPKDSDGGKTEDEEESEGRPLPGHGAVLQGHQGGQEAKTQNNVHVPGQEKRNKEEEE